MNFLHLSPEQRRAFYKQTLLQQTTESTAEQLKSLFKPLLKAKNKQCQEDQSRYKEFRNGNRKQVYSMIHIDAKRCLWHYFEEDNLQEYLSKSIKIQNKQGLTRFHQRYLELFLIDIMIRINTKNYFQGMSLIFQCIYFIFMKEEYLSDDDQVVQQYIENDFQKEQNDFKSIDGGINDILYDYEDVLTISVNFFNNVLSVLIKNEITTTIHIQMAIEPYLRFFDCQLYDKISQDEQLRSLSPNMLMGSIFSCLQYNVQKISSCVKIMDAIIQGDYYFLVFLSCANFSLAFRAHNPGILGVEERFQIPLTDNHNDYQIKADEEDQIVNRVMTSLENIENIIQDYPMRIIEFAYIGYQLVLFSRQQTKEKYVFIKNNFDFKKKTTFQQTILSMQQQTPNADMFTTIQYPFMTQYKDVFLQMILDSVSYNLTYNIKLVPVDTRLQLIGNALERSNKTIKTKLYTFAQNVAEKLDMILTPKNNNDDVNAPSDPYQNNTKTDPEE